MRACPHTTHQIPLVVSGSASGWRPWPTSASMHIKAGTQETHARVPTHKQIHIHPQTALCAHRTGSRVRGQVGPERGCRTCCASFPASADRDTAKSQSCAARLKATSRSTSQIVDRQAGGQMDRQAGGQAGAQARRRAGGQAGRQSAASSVSLSRHLNPSPQSPYT